MKISINWIREILGADIDPSVAAERLTMAGTEVEGVQRVAALDPGILVAEVVETVDHPRSARSGLKVVTVWDGSRKVQVVCGAPNTPGPGARVVFAGTGLTIQGVRLEPRSFDGIESTGMLCSEEETGIGQDASGIIVLDEAVAAGTPLRSAFPLEDHILDLSTTPNRPDLLGHLGVARELSVLMGVPLSEPRPREGWEELDEATADLVRIVIEDPEGCPRYTAAVVKNVSIGPSPLVMRSRLAMLGVRPISNAVDVTNWILLLHNQPLHAFDLKRVTGRTIIVRRARENERVITLDGVDRYLDGHDLVIADAASPVAVAGVMGGEGSGILEDTRDVLIECAYFSPATIRRTSSKLNLTSESSYRFERGIDPTSQIRALRDAAGMMADLTRGKVARALIDVHPRPHVPAAVTLRRQRVGRILGADIDWKASLDILGRLGCGVRREDAAAASAELAVPAFRPDLTREIDLIEEIARIRGFDAIPSRRPVITVGPPERSSYDRVRAVRRELAAGGFMEAVNLSIVDGTGQKLYFPDARPVVVANPLSSEKDVMRVSLIPDLLDNLARALQDKARAVRMFEVGTVFRLGEGGIVEGIVETTHAAAVAFGPRPGWVGEKRGEADFFDMVGLLGHLVDAVWHVAPAIARASAGAPVFLAPASACGVTVQGEACGWVGELHPEVCRRLELPKARQGREKVGILEIRLPSLLPVTKKFRPIPAYPTAERDIAMIFDESVEAETILGTIRREAGAILESVSLFDIYRGSGPSWEGRRSLAFSLVYRSAETTLRTEEIDAVHGRVVSALERTLGGKLR